CCLLRARLVFVGGLIRIRGACRFRIGVGGRVIGGCFVVFDFLVFDLLVFDLLFLDLLVFGRRRIQRFDRGRLFLRCLLAGGRRARGRQCGYLGLVVRLLVLRLCLFLLVLGRRGVGDGRHDGSENLIRGRRHIEHDACIVR